MTNTPRVLRRWSPAVVLGLAGGISVIIYGLALLRFPLFSIYRCPLQNLDKLSRPGVANGIVLANYTCPTLPPEQLPKPDLAIGLVLAGAVLLLFACYIVGMRVLRGMARPARRVRLLIVTVPLALIALLVPVYQATSTDLFDYAFRGRMVAHYQANNFLQTPRDFQDDPLFWYVAWRRSVSAYGPVWEGMSLVTARIAGQNTTKFFMPPELGGAKEAIAQAELLRLLLAYKVLAAVGFLLCALVIWGALGQIAPAWRWFGVFLWLWNPLALWESVAAGHNDAWMAALLVAAVWAFSAARAKLEQPEGRSQESRSQESRTQNSKLKTQNSALSAQNSKLLHLVTVSPLHLITLSFVALTLGGLIKYSALFFGPLLLALALRWLPNARLRLLVTVSLVCGTLVVLAYLPFWAGPETLRNFSDRRELLTASWLAALQPLLMTWMSRADSQLVGNLIGLFLLVFGVGWSAWRAWHRPLKPLASHMLWLLLWFLFIANPWFQPWYLLWALALVALQPWRVRAVRGVVVFCATALLSYLAGAFLLSHLGWPGEGAAWNALISALIYLPPLVAFAWGGPPLTPRLRRLSRHDQQTARPLA